MGRVSISFCCLSVSYREISVVYRYHIDYLVVFLVYRYRIDSFFLYIGIVTIIYFHIGIVSIRFLVNIGVVSISLCCLSVSYRLDFLVNRYRVDYIFCVSVSFRFRLLRIGIASKLFLV